ncbi:hypothetical protein [Streptomyces sp. NPDC048172]|uniref:hypothetical protein n=1 Tax=Streptomyces sp. NPDC048172 TaxID=3365505 RepID=UPI00371BCC94
MDFWDRAGRWAAYGAALALTPYLVIKVVWVLGSGFDSAGWILLNTVTIGMAGIGITLALALVRPWGTRIPGRLVVLCAWTGAGFLVPVLPYALLSAVLDPPRTRAWEGALLQAGFVGMGLGLALALPAYMRRRWPYAFEGDRHGPPPRTGAVPAALAAGAGLVWLYWAVGGGLGVAHPGERSTGGAVLAGLGGCWALVGAVAVRALVRGRPRGRLSRAPRWVPLVLGFLGSGSLFAWSGWKLPVTALVALGVPVGLELPEEPVVAVAVHAAAVVAGAGLLRTLLAASREPAPGQGLSAGPVAGPEAPGGGRSPGRR